MFFEDGNVSLLTLFKDFKGKCGACLKQGNSVAMDSG